jgi:hypothetical protein
MRHIQAMLNNALFMMLFVFLLGLSAVVVAFENVKGSTRRA